MGVFNPKKCTVADIPAIAPFPEITDCEVPPAPAPITDCPDPVLTIPGDIGEPGGPGPQGAQGPCPQIDATATANAPHGAQVAVTGPKCAPVFTFTFDFTPATVGPQGPQGGRGAVGPCPQVGAQISINTPHTALVDVR